MTADKNSKYGSRSYSGFGSARRCFLFFFYYFPFVVQFEIFNCDCNYNIYMSEYDDETKIGSAKVAELVGVNNTKINSEV